ncbi:MAG: hypothetical protein J6J00_05025 [Treponema sp.]|nr:hypothetical protein [Treponema sp.]
MTFSTLNESSLHKTLKIMYSQIYEGQTEVESEGHVYDIVTKKGNIIEIQTKNLSKLLPKIKDAISKGHNVKVVHPNILDTKIELYDEENNLLSSRKSPKKGCIYDIFKELTGLYPILLDKRFSLEIIQISMIEKRLRTKEAEQSKNKKRRFKKNWQKEDKRLSEIHGTIIFNSAEQYLALLPSSLPQEFTAKDLAYELKGIKELPERISKDSHLIIWVLEKMQLLERCGTKNRSRLYRIVKTNNDVNSTV